MRMRRDVFPSAPAFLAGLALGVLLLLPACSDSGPHSLSDTKYWRSKIGKGEGIEDVVKQGRAAVPLLNTLLGDGNEYVVQYAAMAVQQIAEQQGPQTVASTVPALVNALVRYPDQAYVTQALKSTKGEAVAQLIPLLGDANVEIQEQAVKALNGIGAPAADAMEPLLRIAEDKSAPAELRKQALVTLGSIGEEAVSAIPRIDAIARSEDALRQTAAMANKRLKYAKRVREKGGDR